jgi:phospholipid/cholesterol/gamma-HCH transport system substrate-binding protein
MANLRLRQASVELTVGLFVLVVLVTLGICTILLSTEKITGPKYTTEVVFETVTRLRAGDKVTVRGLEVGAVSRLWLEPDGVHVRLTTGQPLLMRQDYTVEIVPSSVLGGQYVEVSVGSIDAPPLAQGLKIRGKTPVNFIDEANEIFQGLREALIEGGILKNLEKAMVELSVVTEKLGKGEGTIGKLLTDEEAYERITTIARNLETVSGDIRDGKGTLGLLVSDETVFRDVQATAANLKEISNRLNSGQGVLGRLLTEDDGLYTDLQETMSAVREVATQIRDGKGTLGKLTMEEELYVEARLLLNEVRAAVDDFRETSPITSFSSVFFGVF